MGIPQRLMRTACAAAVLAGLFGPACTVAAPRTPQDQFEILERLPPRPPHEASGASSQDTLQQVLDEVPALLHLAQSEGDPRFLGQAEARLAPWLDAPTVPPQLRLLQARVLQAGHRFEEASGQLDAVLDIDPRNGAALLLQASIHQVRGEYARAAETCRRARTPEALLLALACGAMIDGLQGEAHTALAELTRIAALARTLTPDQQAWISLGLGDLADRLGEDRIAAESFHRVAFYSPDTLAAWCDWLLEHERAGEVVAMLQAQRRHDGLLLRLTRAELVLGLAAAQDDIRELGARFTAAAQRGERTHLREEAQFALYLLGDAGRALELARANWQQQREPADARIWLQAARVQGERSDIDAVRAWLQRTGLQDRHLEIESRAESGVLASAPAMLAQRGDER